MSSLRVQECLAILEIEEKEVSLKLLKKHYHNLSKLYHPDFNSSGTEMMKLVNNAYDFLKDQEFPILNKGEKENFKIHEKLRNAIYSIKNLDGVVIEICGLWIWVSGDTRKHKDALKKAGYFWAHQKRMWYFRNKEYATYNGGKTLDIDEIRSKFGSVKFSYGQQKSLSY